MLLSAVSVLVVAQSSSEIPEGLMNNPVFIVSILIIYYIRHNYMFRPLMLAIFRLYTNTYQVVKQTYVGCI